MIARNSNMHMKVFLFFVIAVRDKKNCVYKLQSRLRLIQSNLVDDMHRKRDVVRSHRIIESIRVVDDGQRKRIVYIIMLSTEKNSRHLPMAISDNEPVGWYEGMSYMNI